jgi:hypothetical protein
MLAITGSSKSHLIGATQPQKLIPLLDQKPEARKDYNNKDTTAYVEEIKSSIAL